MSQSNGALLWLKAGAGTESTDTETAASSMASATAISAQAISLNPNRIVGFDPGHRGTRQAYKCRSRILANEAGGSFSGFFGPAELDFLLPYVFGTKAGSAASSPYVPGDALPYFYALVRKDNKASDKKHFIYNKLRIASIDISGSGTQFINYNINVMGESEVAFSGTLPTTTAQCESAYAFPDITFVHNDITYPIQSFRLRIDNAIDNQKYENALNPTRFETTDFIVTLDIMVDYRNDTMTSVDIRALHQSSATGVTGSLNFNNLPVASTVVSYEYAFANLHCMTSAVPIPPGGRVNMPITFMASRNVADTSTDQALTVTKTVV